MRRIVTYFTAASLATLFAGGLWLRVTSLESMPYPDGDEAWYGIQAERFLAGKSVAYWTPTGNPLNPFFTGMEVPLLGIFRPALWILRVPSVACGILAVVLSYVLVSKLFDRTTGLISATLMATLPVTILFSRIGFDAGQTPLFSLLALYFAFRGKMAYTLLAFTACVLIHPTNVFLAPILISVLAVRVVEKTAGNPRKRSWMLGGLAVLPSLAAIGFGLHLLHRPGVPSSALRELDWPRFFTLLGRLFFGIGQFPLSEITLAIHDGSFRGAILGLLGLGLVPLIRKHRRDVVAMIAGLLVGVAAFHIIGGRDAIRTEWVSYLRYGLFAVVPAVIAASCLARCLLVEPDSPRREGFRTLQNFAMISVSASLLLSVKTCWFDRFASAGHESMWSFRTDAKDPHRQILSSLLHDKADRGDRSIRVYAQDQWIQRPIRFLAGSRDDLRVMNLDEMARTPAKIREALQGPMTEGAYAVGPAGGKVERAITQLFPPGSLRAWGATLNGTTYLVLYRLKREGESDELARRDRAGSRTK